MHEIPDPKILIKQDIRHLLVNPAVDAQGEELAKIFENKGYEVESIRSKKKWDVLFEIPGLLPEFTFFYDFDSESWKGSAIEHADRLGVDLPSFVKQRM